MTDPAEAVLGRVAPLLPDAPIAVALSGGADSAVLAWAAQASGRTVRGITADHGLAVSGPLVAAARSVAVALGIPHVVVAAPATDDETALRAARYEAIEQAVRPDEVPATGHTADDQAETVLGNLLRGAGAVGLSGIPRARGRWVRPLRDVTRAETRAAAEALGLPFADDPDNADRTRRRVRLRVEVIPYLARSVNPAVADALRRAGDLAAADEEVLARRADRVPVRWAAGEARIPAAALAVLPEAVASRVVRRALRDLLAPYPGSRRDVAQALLALEGRSPRSISGGLLARREGPWLVIYPAGAASPIPAPVALEVPGAVEFGQWAISARAGGPGPRPHPVGRRRAVIAAGGALEVRAASPGERLDIGSGSKPVRSVLREAGIAARHRDRWPVVTVGGRMAWVAAVRLADWAKTAAAGPVIVLEARELEP